MAVRTAEPPSEETFGSTTCALAAGSAFADSVANPLTTVRANGLI
jgi:hypothetical protein